MNTDLSHTYGLKPSQISRLDVIVTVKVLQKRDCENWRRETTEIWGNALTQKKMRLRFTNYIFPRNDDVTRTI